MSAESRRWLIVAGLIVAYFVAVPGDLSAVLAPAREILSLSNAISTGLYVVAGAGVIAYALVLGFYWSRGNRSDRPTS